MTVLVAAKCSDGIVVGADSLSTSAAGIHPLMMVRSNDKISIIDGKIIVAGTGSVGLSQRFNVVVENLHTTNNIFSSPYVPCCKAISANAIMDFSSTFIQRDPNSGFGFGAILAAPMADQCELVEFGLTDFQPERKVSRLHYVSMGSGQLLADPFLAFISRVLWNRQEPTVQLAKMGVYWALAHAIEFAPGGVGMPVQMATLRKEGEVWRANLVQEGELGELQQHIEEISARISRYPAESISEATAVPIPTVPVANEVG